MSLSAPFIRRPVGTSLVMAGILLLGLVAYRFLPVAPLPQVEFPTIMVMAQLPGASPETMASAVAAPLERRFASIGGVSEITSSSSLGAASVVIQFDPDRSIDGAAKDVEAAINAAAGELPGDLPSPPRYRKLNPADAPIMVLALTSETLPPGEVFNAADSVLGQRLSQVPGVSQVQISGAEKTAVRVRVNPGALATMGLGLEEVRQALAGANVLAPTGSLEGDGQSFTIGVDGQLFDAAAYRSLVVAERNGTAIRLDAVAAVVDGVENTRLAGWYGRDRAVLVLIQKQTGANVIETVDRIKELLPQLERWMPPAVKVSVLSDRTTTIRASVRDVQFTLMLATVLVVLVVALFLRRFWATVIPAVTIPLALTGTFAVMYLAGYSLDNLSLMALTIAVGFVVDDAIVVVENVVRHLEAGLPPLQAALQGARQVGFTVMAISLSLVAVFIPLLFMGGMIGRLFHEFAVTLSAAIAVSALVSLTLTPMMCSRLLRLPADPRQPGRLGRALEAAFDTLLAAYGRGLGWVLAHRRLGLAATFLTIIGTVWLYVVVPKGFVPQQDTGLVIGITDAAQDISFQAMSARQQALVEAVLADPAVDGVGSFIGASGGNSAMNQGRLFIRLRPAAERPDDLATVLSRLRRAARTVTGIVLYPQPVQDLRIGGRQGKGQFQYALSDADLGELMHWAPLVLERLQRVPELTDVGSDQTGGGLQAMVTVDRDAAARFGIQPEIVDQTLYDAFGQRQVSTLYTPINQYHVVLEVDPALQLDPAALRTIRVPAAEGRQVPLSAIARFETAGTPLAISHQGQFPAVTLSFSPAPGVSLGQATAAVEAAMRDLALPAGLTGSFQGTAQAFRSSLATQPILIATALLTIYIVLGVLYESLLHPLTILSTLPSSGVGALLALLLTGDELSLMSLIGIILLMGIVKKNAIMVVDFALEAERTHGLGPEQAIRQACLVRFRPILMTTMAALFGALPLALGHGAGSELRHPLGIAVVGGLLLSQLVTLYTTPVVYLALERLAAGNRASWQGRRAGRPAPAG